MCTKKKKNNEASEKENLTNPYFYGSPNVKNLSLCKKEKKKS